MQFEEFSLLIRCIYWILIWLGHRGVLQWDQGLDRPEVQQIPPLFESEKEVR